MDSGRKLQAITDMISTKDKRICVCISPWERTEQTLLGLYKGGFGGPEQRQVKYVHLNTQIREQEFGNFQDPGLTSKVTWRFMDTFRV